MESLRRNKMAPVLFTMALLLITGISKSHAAETCTFTSRTYNVGDVWYPRLEQPGALHCVACVCQEGGKINCAIHQCTEDCSSPQTSTECCKYCPKPKAVTATTTSLPKTRMTNETSTAGGETVTTCLHNGVKYQHKEKFISTNALKKEFPNTCVECSCEMGMVICRTGECAKPDCENPIRTRDDCCAVCPDLAGRLDDMDNSPVVIQQPDTKMEDCISGGRYYLHGTTWHPVMGPFGPMDCVVCECKSGRIECHRLECPSRQTMNCERPVKVAGRCCPVCPIDMESQNPVTSPPPVAARPVGRIPAPRLPTVKSKERGPDSTSLCLPKDHDLIAYRAQAGGNSSEFIQYIFQKVGSGDAEHHLWMLRHSETTYKVQDLTKDQVEALKQRFQFAVLGATMTKHMKKFTRREKKLQPKCKPNTGCPKRIRRLERNLSLQQIQNRKMCLPTEVEAQ